MSKSDIQFLKHIKEETEFIIEFTSTISEEEFLEIECQISTYSTSFNM